MDTTGMVAHAVASGNILAMKKAMDSQENIMSGLLNGMEANSQNLHTTSATQATGVNTATDGGIDIRI